VNFSMAGLLAKFRIDYSDVIVIPDIAKKAAESTKKKFENMIAPLKGEEHDGMCITTDELISLKEKTNRHLRLRELLQEHSKASTFVVMYVKFQSFELFPFLVCFGGRNEFSVANFLFFLQDITNAKERYRICSFVLVLVGNDDQRYATIPFRERKSNFCSHLLFLNH